MDRINVKLSDQHVILSEAKDLCPSKKGNIFKNTKKGALSAPFYIVNYFIVS